MSRRAELADNLGRVRTRIATASDLANRDPASVTLVVISKYFPASDVRVLAGLGVTDFGENRHPEAMEKRAECADLDIRWHFVGGMQSNKAAVIGSYADVVQSLDRLKLVAALERGAAQAQRAAPVECFVQVSLDLPSARDDRSGVQVAELENLARAVEQSANLSLGGLMAVAPLGESAGPAFARLAAIQAQFLESFPSARALSAGMSGDLEEAINAGATHVRVGRSVLGLRPAFQ